ncbi:transglycosylase family protein [Streptomyces sulfonofaciens]|uniref:transglycosylase family protein n=1 Tax=Streptomyces sulfonofaciens TaxID=68272 RepID=UPI0027E489D4|nr:transglycosylase family protein [Streptomyces sulfonofaciens]
MTGSAIAIPLLGAANAQAADGSTWDRLANCESGGSWSADPGNGYYGGLQLSPNMWVLYGGLDYAPRADQASRSEQIAVAEKVLADRGPGAWPGCADVVGLTAKGGSSASPSASGADGGPTSSGAGATTDPSGASGAPHDSGASAPPSEAPSHVPGSSPSSGTGDSFGSTGGRSTGGGDGSQRSGPSGSADSSAGAGGSSAGEGGAPGSSSAGDGAGRHRGDHAHEGSRARADDSRGDGRHASRGAGEEGRGGDEGVYTVRPGDNLSDIAESHDLDGGWPALYAANKKTVGADPDLILPGQTLDLS